MDLHGRSFLKVTDLNAEEFRSVVDQSRRLRAEKKAGVRSPPTTRAGTSPTSAPGKPSSATRSP